MGIAERKEREREQRCSEIINAAEKIFSNNGFEQTTMDNVANQAELSKATLYSYFKSKEELYFAVCICGQRQLYSMIDHAMENIDNTYQSLLAFLKAIVKFQKSYPGYFQAMVYFQMHRINLDSKSEEVKENHKLDQIFLKKWIELFDKGEREDLIRQDINPINSGLLIWMQLNGFLKIFSVMRCELETDFNIAEDDLINDYYDLVFKGISKK